METTQKDEWVNDICYIYIKEYYSFIKRSEVLICYNMGEP